MSLINDESREKTSVLEALEAFEHGFGAVERWVGGWMGG